MGRPQGKKIPFRREAYERALRERGTNQNQLIVNRIVNDSTIKKAKQAQKISPLILNDIAVHLNLSPLYISGATDQYETYRSFQHRLSDWRKEKKGSPSYDETLLSEFTAILRYAHELGEFESIAENISNLYDSLWEQHQRYENDPEFRAMIEEKKHQLVLKDFEGLPMEEEDNGKHNETRE